MLVNSTLRTLVLLSAFSLATTIGVAQQPGSKPPGVPDVPGSSRTIQGEKSSRSDDSSSDQSLPVIDMPETDMPETDMPETDNRNHSCLDSPVGGEQMNSRPDDSVLGEQFGSSQTDPAVSEYYFRAPATPDDVLNSHHYRANACVPRCCYDYCCDPSRTWTFRAGAIFLHRSQPNNQPLFTDSTGSGMNANGFNPGWGSGVDASLIRHRAFGTNNDLELRYFGIDNWMDSQSMRLNGTPVTIQNNPPTSVPGGRDVSSQYSQSLVNTELNLRRRVANNWTFIGGLRYLQLNEQLNSQLTNGPVPGDDHHYNVAALNDLFGVQAGLMYDLCSSCDCCVQLYGKAGIYANHAAQHTSLNCFCTPPMNFSANGSTTQAASVGDFGITGSKRIWKNLALLGGYQVLILDGVATAPGQFPVTNLVSQSGLGNNSTVLFHGATIGLELTY